MLSSISFIKQKLQTPFPSDGDIDTSLNDIIILPAEQETDVTDVKKLSRKTCDKSGQVLSKPKLNSCKTKAELKPEGQRGTKCYNQNILNLEEAASNFNTEIHVDTGCNQDLINVLKHFADEISNVYVSMEMRAERT